MTESAFNPEPTHHLKWGEDIPKDVMTAMRKGENALLHDAEGNPYSVVLIDYFGTIREKPLKQVCYRKE